MVLDRHDALPHLVPTWTPERTYCSGCGASTRLDLDSDNETLCRSCERLFQLDVATLKTTVFQRFETPGAPTSKTGPSASTICAAWLNPTTGQVFDAYSVMKTSLSKEVERVLAPCSRPRHLDPNHEWELPKEA